MTLADRIFEAAHLTGSFTLRSGQVTSEYFDKYRFESDPELLGEIARMAASRIPADVDGLAGLELGGVPLATALSAVSGIRAYFVRKRAKEYGTRKLCEGGEVEGLRLLVVEDVVTSGGQVERSAGDLRAAGARVTDALCVIDRQAGGSETLARSGVTLHALFTMDQLGPRRAGPPA
ncbi:MAG: orotate phosphoribosyltransferase [Acidimicrobiales bacterium]